MKLFCSFFFLLSFFGGCAQDEHYDTMLRNLYTGDVPIIHPQQLNDTLKNGTKVLLLDSREKKEFDVSHIKGAIHIGYDTLCLDSLKNISKNTFIVVYCSVGYRSEKIGEKLIEAGYMNVLNLYGGIFEWVNEGYTVIDNSGQPTNRVHAYSRAWGIWLKKGEKVYD